MGPYTVAGRTLRTARDHDSAGATALGCNWSLSGRLDTQIARFLRMWMRAPITEFAMESPYLITGVCPWHLAGARLRRSRRPGAVPIVARRSTRRTQESPPPALTLLRRIGRCSCLLPHPRVGREYSTTPQSKTPHRHLAAGRPNQTPTGRRRAPDEASTVR